MVSALLLMLVVSGAMAAPTEPSANPHLEGLDSFLAAFDGLALPGDPLADVTTATDPPEVADPPPELPEATVVPKAALCLGCVQEITADSAHLRRVSQLAATLLEEQLNTTEVMAVTQVYRAAEQVVNGIKYFLTLELSTTNCSRPREEGDECSADAVADRLLYKVELLEHPQAHNSSTELLSSMEVAPEEVADLSELFAGPEPPTPPPASEEPGVAGNEADLAALIGDMEMVTLLSAPDAGLDHSEMDVPEDPPADATAQEVATAAGA